MSAPDLEAPYMGSSPFTPEQVRNYNAYSFYDVDINKDFDAGVENQENKVKKYYPDLENLPDAVKTALAYYRKANYEWYLEHTRATNKAPPMYGYGVGPSNYRGNRQKAHRIEEKAMEKLHDAEEWVDRAIMRSRKAEKVETVSNKTGLRVGSRIQIGWTNCNNKYEGEAVVKKVNTNSIRMELTKAPEEYSVGRGWSIPLNCTPGNWWKLL